MSDADEDFIKVGTAADLIQTMHHYHGLQLAQVGSQVPEHAIVVGGKYKKKQIGEDITIYKSNQSFSMAVYLQAVCLCHV